MYTLIALAAGFIIDLIIGDPHSIPHPVIFIGKLISATEKLVRRVFSKTVSGERAAGAVLWLVVVAVSAGIPLVILKIAYSISAVLGIAIEAVMCWQCLATKSLKDESMKVYDALKTGDLKASRYAVSMIVGRDTERLDDAGVTKAAVETVAENTSDGIIAPMLFLAIGGAPLGFFYKAVNTMDSMVGYIEEPYTNLGFFPAKLDDVFNWIPARLSALMMLAAGAILGLDVKNGWKIFKRDRFKHASPNSAQTESVCAGLFGLQLAGDAWYHGILSKKEFIGDPIRPIEHEDIPRSCKLLYATAGISLLLFCVIRLIVIIL